MSDYCSGLRWGPFSHLAAPHKNVNTALLWKAASGTGAAQMDHHTEFLGLCQEQREGCCSCLPHAPITAGTPQAGGAVGDRIILWSSNDGKEKGFSLWTCHRWRTHTQLHPWFWSLKVPFFPVTFHALRKWGHSLSQEWAVMLCPGARLGDKVNYLGLFPAGTVWTQPLDLVTFAGTLEWNYGSGKRAREESTGQ